MRKNKKQVAKGVSRRKTKQGWVYKLFDLGNGYHSIYSTDGIKQLNEIAKDGWEIVEIVKQPGCDWTTAWPGRGLFKRWAREKTKQPIYDVDSAITTSGINKLINAGWELVSVIAIERGMKQDYRYFFKRSKGRE